MSPGNYVLALSTLTFVAGLLAGAMAESGWAVFTRPIHVRMAWMLPGPRFLSRIVSSSVTAIALRLVSGPVNIIEDLPLPHPADPDWHLAGDGIRYVHHGAGGHVIMADHKTGRVTAADVPFNGRWRCLRYALAVHAEWRARWLREAVLGEQPLTQARLSEHP